MFLLLRLILPLPHVKLSKRCKQKWRICINTRFMLWHEAVAVAVAQVKEATQLVAQWHWMNLPFSVLVFGCLLAFEVHRNSHTDAFVSQLIQRAAKTSPFPTTNPLPPLLPCHLNSNSNSN